MGTQSKTSIALGLAALAGEGALQVSGYQNIYIAWGLGIAAGAFLVYGASIWMAEKWPQIALLERIVRLRQRQVRMPLTKFYGEAKRLGWDFADITGHAFDLTVGLKQAGADGSITFYGTRVHRIPALTEDGFLEEIPKEYWLKCKLDALSPLQLHPTAGHVIGLQEDNRKTETYNPQSNYNILNYRDLHVTREQAMKWLRHESKQHMGRFNRESRS